MESLLCLYGKTELNIYYICILSSAQGIYKYLVKDFDVVNVVATARLICLILRSCWTSPTTGCSARF